MKRVLFAAFASLFIFLFGYEANAETSKEVLTKCSAVAKRVATESAYEDEKVEKITQTTAWLSGYEPVEEFQPIMTVMIDIELKDASASYVGYKVTLEYNTPVCELVKLEKLPLLL